MKLLISSFLSICILAGCAPMNSELSEVRLKGSESMHAVFTDLKKNFEKRYANIHILLEGGGSKTGLKAIKEHTADIGLSSFAFDLSEELGTDHSVTEQVIAYDGIVLITNELNPIDSLTNAQIEDIYEGQVVDWSEMGGKPGTIVPIIRDQNSGTQKFFTSHFAIESVSGSAVVLEENKDIVRQVHSNVNAIGFIGFAYFANGVHEIKLASDNFRFRAPTKSNLLNNSYPLKRGLRIYYKGVVDVATQTFLDYMKTPEAKLIIESYGLIVTN